MTAAACGGIMNMEFLGGIIVGGIFLLWIIEIIRRFRRMT